MRRQSMQSVLIVITVIFLMMTIPACSDDDNPVVPKVTYSWKQEVTYGTDVLYGISGTASDNVLIGGAGGRLLHWDGTKFNLLEKVCTSRITDIHALTESSIWMCTYNDSIFHYNGTTWTKYKGNTDQRLYAIFAISDTDVWVAGDQGQVSHFDGAWTASVVGDGGVDGDYWQGLWGTASNNIMLVGYKERVYKYTGTWELIAPYGVNNNCMDVWGTSADNIYIAAWSKIFHYDGGSDLTLSVDVSPWRYYGVWGSSADDIFVVGNEGKIVHWNGSQWQYMTSNTILSFRGVWGSGPGDVFAVGDGGVVMHYCKD